MLSVESGTFIELIGISFVDVILFLRGKTDHHFSIMKENISSIEKKIFLSFVLLSAIVEPVGLPEAVFPRLWVTTIGVSIGRSSS